MFFPGNPFQLCLLFVGKTGAYLIQTPLRCSIQGYFPALSHKHQTVIDKHSSLLWKVVNYGLKKFNNVGPRSAKPRAPHPPPSPGGGRTTRTSSWRGKRRRVRKVLGKTENNKVKRSLKLFAICDLRFAIYASKHTLHRQHYSLINTLVDISNLCTNVLNDFKTIKVRNFQHKLAFKLALIADH